jgi:hypothetical protein
MPATTRKWKGLQNEISADDPYVPRAFRDHLRDQSADGTKVSKAQRCLGALEWFAKRNRTTKVALEPLQIARIPPVRSIKPADADGVSCAGHAEEIQHPCGRVSKVAMSINLRLNPSNRQNLHQSNPRRPAWPRGRRHGFLTDTSEKPAAPILTAGSLRWYLLWSLSFER